MPQRLFLSLFFAVPVLGSRVCRRGVGQVGLDSQWSSSGHAGGGLATCGWAVDDEILNRVCDGLCGQRNGGNAEDEGKLNPTAP